MVNINQHGKNMNSILVFLGGIRGKWMGKKFCYFTILLQQVLWLSAVKEACPIFTGVRPMGGRSEIVITSQKLGVVRNQIRSQ